MAILNISVSEDTAIEIYSYLKEKAPAEGKVNRSALLSDLLNTGLKVTREKEAKAKNKLKKVSA